VISSTSAGSLRRISAREKSAIRRRAHRAPMAGRSARAGRITGTTNETDGRATGMHGHWPTPGRGSGRPGQRLADGQVRDRRGDIEHVQAAQSMVTSVSTARSMRAAIGRRPPPGRPPG
jgi:hypothetical protein